MEVADCMLPNMEPRKSSLSILSCKASVLCVCLYAFWSATYYTQFQQRYSNLLSFYLIYETNNFLKKKLVAHFCSHYAKALIHDIENSYCIVSAKNE
jgi:hypothetical protein